MKNPAEKYMRYLVLAFVSCYILIIPGAFVAFKYFPNSIGAQFLCMSVTALLPYIIVSTILGIKVNKANKAYKSAIKEKAKEKLTSGFQKVQLKTADVISKDMFECQAKIDDDGKIICKIHANYVNYETKFNNYEEFIQFFSLDDK